MPGRRFGCVRLHQKLPDQANLIEVSKQVLDWEVFICEIREDHFDGDRGNDTHCNQEEEQEAGLKVTQLNEHVESDDEVDEFIFPEGDKFGDKFDIQLKGKYVSAALMRMDPGRDNSFQGRVVVKSDIGHRLPSGFSQSSWLVRAL
ncbi:hypothetical protein Tco_1427447 [Tanacetum coccineum]